MTIQASPYLSSIITPQRPQGTCPHITFDNLLTKIHRSWSSSYCKQQQGQSESKPAYRFIANILQPNANPTGAKAKSRKRARSDATSPETTSTQKKNKKAAAPKSKPLPPLPIPSKYDDAVKADQMLFDDKNNGVDMGKIHKKWNEMTGRNVTKGTLFTRYARLKTNFEDSGLDNEVRKLILDTEKEVMKKFQQEVVKKFESSGKWNEVAKIVSEKAGKTYTGAAVHKVFRGSGKKRTSKRTATNSADARINTPDEDDEAPAGLMNNIEGTPDAETTVNPLDVFGSDDMGEMGDTVDDPVGSSFEDAEGEEDDDLLVSAGVI